VKLLMQIVTTVILIVISFSSRFILTGNIHFNIIRPFTRTKILYTCTVSSSVLKVHRRHHRISPLQCCITIQFGLHFTVYFLKTHYHDDLQFIYVIYKWCFSREVS
jgi:hypothetical protein